SAEASEADQRDRSSPGRPRWIIVRSPVYVWRLISRKPSSTAAIARFSGLMNTLSAESASMGRRVRTVQLLGTANSLIDTTKRATNGACRAVYTTRGGGSGA